MKFSPGADDFVKLSMVSMLNSSLGTVTEYGGRYIFLNEPNEHSAGKHFWQFE